MPTEKSVEELKTEIATLQNRVSELSDKNDKLQTENYSLGSEVRNLQKEKDKLLAIIENLSKGLAALGDRK